MKRTKKITLSAMLCALCVVALLAGSLVNVLDASAAILASFIMIVAVSELGTPYSLGIYASASLLALLLLPEKSPAVYFLFFSGYYPIIVRRLSLLPKVLSWFVKFIIFNCAMVGVYLVLLFIIGGIEPFSLMTVLFFIALNGVFILYDIAMKRMTAFWFFVLRKRFAKILK